MTIKHDVSAVSIVTTCTDCPGIWWAFNFDRDSAYTSGERHQVITHDVAPSTAAEARRMRNLRKKVRDDAENVRDRPEHVLHGNQGPAQRTH